MRWSENGQSVFVAPESKFPAHILSRMSSKSYQSLVRRLYYFGFRKVGGAFHHESFSRGQPSSIRPTREMSHSPSLPSPLSNSTSQRGPRYKIIKRRRTREIVWEMPKGLNFKACEKFSENCMELGSSGQGGFEKATMVAWARSIHQWWLCKSSVVFLVRVTSWLNFHDLPD